MTEKKKPGREDISDEEPEISEKDDLLESQGESQGKEQGSAPSSRKYLPIPSTKKELTTQDALQLYFREINKFTTLEPEEEFELARRVREDNDQDAAFRLVSSHLRLVVKIAMEFQRRWMKNVLELIQEGNIGLMKAVQKFDPERGIKFSYYAAFWIKAYILKFIMDNWRMVKIGTTQSQRKLFYNLGKEKKRLENLGFDADIETISKNLEVSQEDVSEMAMRMGQADLSLDAPFGEDGSATRMDMLPALEASPEDRLARSEVGNILHSQLKTILPELNEKEKEILLSRLMTSSPVTLREIGSKYGITRERVRQIENRLLEKLKGKLSSSISDFSQDWISDE
ncbi:MAG: RNA polymerase factor sigma-32 [Desulfohalobiaceae bacterium]|nr:RNA polymerase factor sigma-32 [Desulfohalobiaceae bacterium]